MDDSILDRPVIAEIFDRHFGEFRHHVERAVARLGLAVTVVVERVVVEAQCIDDAQATAGQFAEDQHLQRHGPARGIPALPAWREPRQRTLDPVAQLAIDRHGHSKKR